MAGKWFPGSNWENKVEICDWLALWTISFSVEGRKPYESLPATESHVLHSHMPTHFAVSQQTQLVFVQIHNCFLHFSSFIAPRPSSK